MVLNYIQFFKLRDILRELMEFKVIKLDKKSFILG